MHKINCDVDKGMSSIMLCTLWMFANLIIISDAYYHHLADEKTGTKDVC